MCIFRRYGRASEGKVNNEGRLAEREREGGDHSRLLVCVCEVTAIYEDAMRGLIYNL